MQIHRVKFRGFGCWVDREFVFHKGINIIEAPNEAGKSTLIQGIFALLYGSKKEGVKKQTKSDWYNRYFPWVGNQYGGEVDYSVHSRTYRIIRTLSLPKNTMQLICLQQAMDITNQFPMDRKKDRLFLEEQIGFSGESLKRIVVLTSHSLNQSKDETEQQVKVIEKMKTTFYGQDVDIQPAIQILDNNIQKIGTIKQETKKLGNAFLRCSQLEEELKKLKRDYRTLMEDISYQSQLEKEKAQVQKKKQELERNRQRLDVALSKHKLQEIDQKIEQLRQGYKSLDLLKEEEAYEKIRLLEEFRELEVQNLLVGNLEQNPLIQHRLAADVARLTELELKGEVVQREKRKANTQLRQSTHASHNGWIIGGVLSFLVGFLSMYWLPFFSVFPMVVGCFIFIMYFITRKKNHNLQKEKENMKQELEEIDRFKLEILKKWHTDSLVTLQELQNGQEQDTTESTSKEQRMERIHQEVKIWLTMFLKDLPPFHPEQWIREIRLLLHQGKEIHELVYQLEVKKLSIHKERPYYELYRGPVSKEMEDLENTYQMLEGQLTKIKEEQARLDGKIEKTSEYVSVLSQKETEWDSQKWEVAKLERDRDAYMLAKEVLMEAASEIHATVGTELVPYASKWLQQITNDRYDEMLIQLHQGLQLHVFNPETGGSQPIDMLSRGTVDQLILSLRLGLLQVYADRTGIVLPLILDDCFAHFDEDRIINALCLLEAFSERGHQIILCTCHERERAKMEQLGIPFQSIYI